MLGAGRYAVTGGAARHVVMIGTDVVRCDCADGGEGEIKVKTLSGNIRVVER